VANPDYLAHLLTRLCAPQVVADLNEVDGLTAHDCSALLAVAARHGVAPLLADRLAGCGLRDEVPQARGLRATREANRLRNEYMLARLVELAKEFQRAALPMLAVKGPVLAHLAYADAGLRTYCDLDLLVRREDLSRVIQLFQRQGYVASDRITEALGVNFFEAVELNLTHPVTRVNIDLHWELSPDYYRFGPLGDEVWERAITIPLGDVAIGTLGHEDHLLYLAVHSARHGWAALSQVCDIAHFVGRVALDWAIVRERAVRSGCRTMLNLSLLLAAELLAAQVPAEVVQGARADRRARALGAVIARDLMADDGASEAPLREVRRAVSAIERPRDRLRYLAIRALQPTLIDWAYRPLPPRWYPAYYVVRPWRIAGAAWRAAVAASEERLHSSSLSRKTDRLRGARALGSKVETTESVAGV
jgi:hypothetical protein